MTTPADILTGALGGGTGMAPGSYGDREHWALDYAKHGYRVLPVWWITEHGHCACPSGAGCGKKAGKHPIPSDWSKIATTDEVQIRDWWRRWPLANIALLMGNGVCAVDIDNEYALEELNSRGLATETPTQRTGGGGYHRLFKWTGKKLRNAVRFMEGADIRTDGGIIIAEPSTNLKGAYSWDGDRHPFEIPLAELPAWVADLCAVENRVVKPPLNLSELWSGIPEGARNGRLFSYACRMRREKRPDLEILAVCLELARRCSPPLSDAEVTLIVASSGRYAEKRDDDGLVCVDVYPEFLSLDLVPKVEIISPWLREKDIAMIHAWRGIGKTWVTLSLACSLTTGTPFLKWTVPEPRGVLLIDGEMPAWDLRKRMAALLKTQGKEPLAPFKLICHDLQERGIPSLDTSAGQDYIERHLEGVSVVIIDNISTLFRFGEENESSSWNPAQVWLLKLRHMGITVVLVHHSGKGGSQRGTSKREDILDSVLCLRRPADYRSENGARFEVHFEKARGISGNAIESFEVQLELDNRTGATWLISTLAGSRDSQIVEMVGLGLAQRTIAQEIGVNQSSVARAIRRLKKEGRI
jgi:hypothetical protein